MRGCVQGTQTQDHAAPLPCAIARLLALRTQVPHVRLCLPVPLPLPTSQALLTPLEGVRNTFRLDIVATSCPYCNQVMDAGA